MYSHDGTLYPLLAVGAFMSMFWTGIVVGNELGLGCVSLLILGFLCACTATVGVCELQRRDGRGLTAPEPAGATRRPAAPGDAAGGQPAGRTPEPAPAPDTRWPVEPTTAL